MSSSLSGRWTALFCGSSSSSWTGIFIFTSSFLLIKCSSNPLRVDRSSFAKRKAPLGHLSGMSPKKTLAVKHAKKKKLELNLTTGVTIVLFYFYSRIQMIALYLSGRFLSTDVLLVCQPVLLPAHKLLGLPLTDEHRISEENLL